MNYEALKTRTGEFVNNIRKTRIVFLNGQNCALLKMNTGMIPIFENDGILEDKTIKNVNGEEYSAIRPYLICYNKVLGCDVLYPMTASQTEESIRVGKRYEQILIPENIYYFINSVVRGGFNADTHSEENVATVDISRGMPIFGQILDEDSFPHIDYMNADFSAVGLMEVREFIDKFYTKESNSEVVRSVQVGATQRWFVGRVKRAGRADFYQHQFMRPSAIYLAMFMNWAENELKGSTLLDIAKIEKPGELYRLAIVSYTKLLRHSQSIEEFKKYHGRTYRVYTEAKTFAIGNFTNLNKRNATLRESLSRVDITPKDREDLEALIRGEQEIDRQVGIVSSAIINYVRQLMYTNMSTVAIDESLLDGLVSLSRSKKFESDLNERLKTLDQVVEQKLKVMKQEQRVAEEKRIAEQERLRKSRLESEQRKVNTVERARANAILAIKLYTGIYGNVIIKASQGDIYTREKIENQDVLDYADSFVKIYDVLLENGDIKQVDNNLPSDRESGEFKRRLEAMSSFVPNVRDSMFRIQESNLARKLQGYLSREIKSVEDEESVQAAIDLLKIVHEEYSKSIQIARKSSIDAGQTPGARVLAKVIKQQDRFADVDLSADSRALEYLNDALSVLENQEYLYQVLGIYAMNRQALGAMGEVKNVAAQLSSKVSEMVKGLSSPYDEIIAKLLTPIINEDSLCKLMRKRYLEVFKDRTISMEESINAILEIKTQFNTNGLWLLGNIDKFKRAIEMLERNFSSRISYLSELALQREERVVGIKKGFGLSPDEGIMENCDEEVATICEDQDGSKIFTKKKAADIDLVKLLFHKYMRDGKYDKNMFYEEMQGTELVGDVVKFIIDVADKSKKWEGEDKQSYVATADKLKADLQSFESVIDIVKLIIEFAEQGEKWEDRDKADYEFVFEIYQQLLDDTYGAVKRTIARLEDVCKRFIESFDFVSSVDKKSLIDKEFLKKIREEAFSSLQERCDGFSQNGMQDIGDYAKQLYNEILFMKIGELSDGDRKKVFGAISKMVLVDNKGLQQKIERIIGNNLHVETIFEDEEIFKHLSYLALMLQPTVDYETLRSEMEEGTLLYDGMVSFDKVIEAEGFINAIDKISRKCKVRLTDGLYRYFLYLLNRLNDLYEQYNYRELSINERKLKTFNNGYLRRKACLLDVIHKIEENRRNNGKPILEEGRDIEEEENLVNTYFNY